MAIPDSITREHVVAAILDFEAGVSHGFGPSTGYDLLSDGKRYPPKAILGLAARQATGMVLAPRDFTGGDESKCFRILRELGFMIVPKDDEPRAVAPAQRNVTAWTFQANPALYDLDQYLSRHTFIYWNCPKFADQVQLGTPVFLKRSGPGGGIVARGAVAELPVPKEQVTKPEYLCDDLWTVAPPEDLLHVGIQLDEVRLSADEGMIPTNVLEAIPELAGHPLVAVRQGTVFRLSAEHLLGLSRQWGGPAVTTPLLGGAIEEGVRRLVTHQRIERNRRLVADKKQAFRDEHGRLFCEVCQMDHAAIYGPLWAERAIEAHHLKPLGEIDGACRTALSDLLLVCSICHALIHQTSDVDGNLARLRQHFSRLT